MKHSRRILEGGVMIMLIATSCFGENDMTERAVRLMSALHFPTNTGSTVSSESVFSGKNQVKTGDFQMKQKRMSTIDAGTVADIEILDKDGQITATGCLIESLSSNGARKVLAEKLVQNSMPINLLIRKYELGESKFGEFCIVEKVLDKTTRKSDVDPSVIHFVRGGKAVSLYTVGKNKDVGVAAKALDDLLLGILSAGKPPNGK